MTRDGLGISRQCSARAGHDLARHATQCPAALGTLCTHAARRGLSTLVSRDQDDTDTFSGMRNVDIQLSEFLPLNMEYKHPS